MLLGIVSQTFQILVSLALNVRSVIYIFSFFTLIADNPFKHLHRRETNDIR